MIYIITALYLEAKPFIERYHLQKIESQKHMQIFKSEDFILIISGSGSIRSTVAVSFLLSKFPASKNDLFYNIGLAGSLAFEQGEIIVCHKLINTYTNRDFYPEILTAHNFKEGVLESHANLVYKKTAVETAVCSNLLFDMEGAFVFEAASFFLDLHQIRLIKIISDRLNPSEVTKEKISEYMKKATELIIFPIRELKNIDFLPEETEYINKLCQQWYITQTMKIALIKNCRISKLRHINFLDDLRNASEKTCKSKNEGKLLYASFMKNLNK